MERIIGDAMLATMLLTAAFAAIRAGYEDLTKREESKSKYRFIMILSLLVGISAIVCSVLFAIYLFKTKEIFSAMFIAAGIFIVFDSYCTFGWAKDELEELKIIEKTQRNPYITK